ncbi:c-type cytochrome [Haliea sp. E1-2-M8]|uniref:c-type cytochrome n=1 Tax=Haliea sp. E1-2-M8 TaxID=3064706 RepID=UPI00272107C4|nr:cytochrome c [Haliea sp. E1-2-M8]MDO8860282.1 c-type cytochrome [Haliea sp. E1-2-M8]
MRLALLPLLVLLAATSGAVSAAPDTSAAELYQPCAACHGVAAGGNAALRAPRLNHLRPVYILAQLDKFQRGLRGGDGATEVAQQMAAGVAMLPPRERWPDLALYISELAGSPSAATLAQGDPTLGGDYFNQFCGACHGPAAGGNVALSAPALAGADDWYLAAQLHAFREGRRGQHREDRGGRQMRSMAAVLPGEQAILDVIAFIRSQPEE